MMKRSKKIRILEFLLIGVIMGVAEDLIAVSLSTGESISWRVIAIVVMVAIPFAFISEVVVDHPLFWEKLWPRKKDEKD